MSTEETRRSFLHNKCLAAAGAASGAFLAITSRLGQASTLQSMSPEQRLRELGIELPPPPRPVAVYVPAVRIGNILFTAGHTPRAPDGTPLVGKVGADMTVEEGHAAARIAGLNLLSSVRSTLGSLDHVVRLVKVLGMVNCRPDFGRQPQVINGFSELLVEVFGEERGKGSRSAVGMASLPGNQPVECEAIFEVRG